MNEKFNKEEIWGLLSKKNQKSGTEDEGEGDGRGGDEAGESKAKHKVDQFSISVACCLGYVKPLLTPPFTTLTVFFSFCSLVTVRRISLILFLVKLLMLLSQTTPLKLGT